MSGGSWEYVYHRVEEIARRLERERAPLRRALGEHLHLVARALHDIEWVDSGDMSEGADEAAIRACLSPHDEARVLAEDLRTAVSAAEAVLVRMAGECCHECHCAKGHKMDCSRGGR